MNDNQIQQNQAQSHPKKQQQNNQNNQQTENNQNGHKQQYFFYLPKIELTRDVIRVGMMSKDFNY